VLKGKKKPSKNIIPEKFAFKRRDEENVRK
jgi:hypothetical protein